MSGTKSVTDKAIGDDWLNRAIFRTCSAWVAQPLSRGFQLHLKNTLEVFLREACQIAMSRPGTRPNLSARGSKNGFASDVLTRMRELGLDSLVQKNAEVLLARFPRVISASEEELWSDLEALAFRVGQVALLLLWFGGRTITPVAYPSTVA